MSKSWMILVMGLLAIGILAVDLSLPLGVAGGVPYVILPLLTVKYPGKQITLISAVICSFLTLIGYYFSPAGVVISVVVANRFLALLAIWVTTILVVYQKRYEKELLDSRNLLDTRVKEKTASLLVTTRNLNYELARRRRAEEQVTAQQDRLIQADKLKSLGMLVAGVAHEINNPNSFIMFNAPILKKAWNGARPYLEKIYEENGDFSIGGMPYSRVREMAPSLIAGISDGSKRIKKIVEKLKDFARPKEAEHKVPVDINKVVEDACALTKSLIDSSTSHFSIEYGENISPILGDHSSLEQVLINLITNSCHSLLSAEKALKVTTFFDEKKSVIVIEVSDEGVGISNNILDKILDPFFTTKRESDGLGLGLSISNRIVLDHGGVMEFKSRPGMGTTVKVILPLIENYNKEV